MNQNYYIHTINRFPLSSIFLCFVAALTVISCTEVVMPQDWPQYKKDNFRSGVVEGNIDLKTFGQRWIYDTGQEPVPAWYGPAREDAYARSGALPSMRDYDLSYYPIVVGNTLYYGSSADDAVHCHEASTGKERWCFNTTGPIHIAPTYFNGKVYVGSDDGFVYCINGYNGQLVWKFSPTESAKKRLLNNGRLISFHPIRTGVLIEDSIAYFGASLLPWKKSYVCAVDAATGKVGKQGTYIKEYDNHSMTLEGAMASSGKVLIQPQGRISPIFINKENGENVGSVSGTGGCFVLVTPEEKVVHGETSRYISMAETKLDKKQGKFMSYKGGKEIVVKGHTTYVLNENSLVAYNRTTEKLIWLRRNFQAYRIIIAGDILFAGTTDKVEGISLKNGQTIWKAPVQGTVYSLSFARNVLYTSTSEGLLYAFGQDKKGGTYYPENEAKAPQIEQKSKEAPKKMKSSIPRVQDTVDEASRLLLTSGPFVQPISSDSVRLSFNTKKAMVCRITWRSANKGITHHSSEPSKEHVFIFPVRKGFNYDYQISADDKHTGIYNFDNFFNFKDKKVPKIPKSNRMCNNRVKEYLEKYNPGVGFCLVMGKYSSETAYTIADLSNMNVVDIIPSHHDYVRFVNLLQKNKSYGRKLSALEVETLNRVPIQSDIADLVWVNNGNKCNPDEIIRLIAPHHHAVINRLEDAQEWLKQSTLDWQVTVVEEEKHQLILRKNPPENIGVWTHQHGDLRNASYGGESLYGSVASTDYETQWMGRPGPRFITDRSGRKPAPLAVSGRMFNQGKERIAAINIYNGSILWMKDIPGLMRMNIPRDCSNWAADNDYLYVVLDNYLMKIDQRTGDITRRINMHLQDDSTSHWGYIGVMDQQIIGTTTTDKAHFREIYGGGHEGWYDAQQGPDSYKVISNRLFTEDKEGKKINWEYIPKGGIINPTIVVANDTILFVESRSVNKESKLSGRGGDDIYKDTRLVALNVFTGKKIYEQRFKTIPGKAAYYMAVNSGVCVVVSSFDGVYDIQAFEVKTGKRIWNQKHKWFHGDHGGHMSKPAIAGNRLVVKPYIYNVHTGKQLEVNVPKSGHGCASYALSDQSMFYRGYSCTIYNFDTGNFSKWDRLRPDCWLSTIPAQGMVLSPEAAGGCSCGLWYETSMVFAPISRAPITIKGHTATTKLDYKKETWGTYASTCPFTEFTDTLQVELILKPGIDVPMYYTTDGREPTKESTRYKGLFTIDKSATVKVAVYINKGGKERRFSRSQSFEQIEEVQNDQ